MSVLAGPGLGLAIGPLNVCGQPYGWANAVRTHLELPAISFAPSSPLVRLLKGPSMDGPAHASVPHHRLATTRIRQSRVRALLRGSSHVLAESLQSLLADPRRSHIGDDLHELNRLGLNVGLVFHGTDIRDPDAHIARHQYSYFNEASSEWLDSIRQRAKQNRSVASDLGLPTFVSTPDLLLDLPNAQWLPLTIDVEEWQQHSVGVLSRPRPVVLHLPSWRNPPIKGTNFIDPVLRDLDDRGAVTYLAPGRVSHDRVGGLVAQADIVVDQIMSGFYGVAAIEAMSAGRLVLGSVGEKTREAIASPVPILDASPSTFREVLEGVLEDPSAGQALAAQGPDFARRWHDGRASAEVLSKFICG